MAHERSVTCGTVGLFAVLLVLTLPARIAAQVGSAAEVADFSFVVRTTDSGIDLTCTKGCAWRTLSFSARVDGASQAVDHYGMTSSWEKRTKERAGPADFLFTVQRTADGVRLQGKRGTEWKSLSFSCDGGCDQAVDQYGMAKRKE